MFAIRLSRQWKLREAVRKFNSTAVMRENKPVTKPSETAVSDADAGLKLKEKVLGARMHHVSDFDRWILVWVKRYPNKADIPRAIPLDTILKAHTLARIRACNYMIVATIIVFIGAIMRGKADAKSGNTVTKRWMDWYENLREEGRLEREQKAEKS